MSRHLKLAYTLLFFALSAPPSAPAQNQKQSQGSEHDITFKIQVPLEFKGRTVSGSLRQSEIEKLLDLPVRNGDSDMNDGYGVEMSRPDYSTFKVLTCREWKKARADKAFAATTYDMAMESSLIDACGLLFELQKAKPPVKSFLANPRVGLANLELLPGEILTSESDNPDDNKVRLQGSTVSKLVPKEDIEKADDDGVTLTYANFRQSFWEGARADFNGDGIEDILVFTSAQAVGGTLGFSEYFFLTRTRPSGPLKVFRKTQP